MNIETIKYSITTIQSAIKQHFEIAKVRTNNGYKCYSFITNDKLPLDVYIPENVSIRFNNFGIYTNTTYHCN